MVNPLNHYSMTNPGTIYDEEALTALELAGRTAAKVNECVGQVNLIDEKIDTEVQEHIDSGDFDDQIDKYAGELRAELKKGVDDNKDYINTRAAETERLTAAIASGKVDKAGNEQVTYAMLAQDVKNAITGGSAAVVGENAVNTANIVDEAVTEEKLANYMNMVSVYDADKGTKPYLIIDKTNATATINPNGPTQFMVRQHNAFTWVNLADCTVDYSAMVKNNGFKIFFNLTTKVFVVAGATVKASNYPGYLYMGLMNANQVGCENKIPVEVNGLFHSPNTYAHAGHSALSMLPTAINMHRLFDAENVVFDINTTAKTVTIIKGGTYNVYTAFKAHSLNFDTVTIDTTPIDWTAGLCYLYFDPVNSKLVFATGHAYDISSNYIYLGLVNWENPHYGDCLVPYSVDGTYLHFPRGDVRELAQLIYYPYNASSPSYPYVRYTEDGGELVFPSLRCLYVMTSNKVKQIYGDDSREDYKVTLGKGYNYLFAGDAGIIAQSNTPTDLKDSTAKYKHYFLGCINTTMRQAYVTFPVQEGATFSIVGDSISTCKGYSLGANPYYDTDKENCWWDRVARRCGLQLVVNNSNSGRRVSDTAGDDNGMNAAKALGRIDFDGVTETNVAPDNIIIYLGINDFIRNVTLSKFSGDYTKMLLNVHENYPAAKVYCCTLPPCERYPNQLGRDDMNTNGDYLSQFNAAIREVCLTFGDEVIELAACGMNKYNASLYMHDWDEETSEFLHPNSAGHRLIANKVCQYIMNGKWVP